MKGEKNTYTGLELISLWTNIGHDQYFLNLIFTYLCGFPATHPLSVSRDGNTNPHAVSCVIDHRQINIRSAGETGQTLIPRGKEGLSHNGARTHTQTHRGFSKTSVRGSRRRRTVPPPEAIQGRQQKRRLLLDGGLLKAQVRVFSLIRLEFTDVLWVEFQGKTVQMCPFWCINCGKSGAGASPAFACNLLFYAEEVGEEKLPNFYFLLLFFRIVLSLGRAMKMEKRCQSHTAGKKKCTLHVLHQSSLGGFFFLFFFIKHQLHSYLTCVPIVWM